MTTFPYFTTDNDGSGNPQYFRVGTPGSPAGPQFAVDWGGDFTVEWWGKANTGNYLGQFLGGQPWFALSGTQLKTWDGAGTVTNTNYSGYANNTWQHFAVTCKTTWLNSGSVDPTTIDGSSGHRDFTVYINGASVLTHTEQGAAPGDPANLNGNGNHLVQDLVSFGLGAYLDTSGTPPGPSGASLSQIRIWEYCRTAADIALWWNVFFTDGNNNWIAPADALYSAGGAAGGFPIAVYGCADVCPTTGDGTRLSSLVNVLTVGSPPSAFEWYNPALAPGAQPKQQGCSTGGPTGTSYDSSMGPIGPITDDETGWGLSDNLTFEVDLDFEEDPGPSEDDDEEATDADKKMATPLAAVDYLTLSTTTYEDLELWPYGDLDIDDGLELSDDVTFPVTNEDWEEDVSLSDDVKLALDFSYQFSSKIQIPVRFSDQYSCDIGITVYNPNPSNIINSPSNVNAPTIVIDGTTAVSNAGTTPNGTVSSSGVYVSINPGICNLLSFNLNLGFGGGTFSLATLTDSLSHSSITLFGLPGIVTEYGPFAQSGGAAAFAYKGVFGTREMNKELILLAFYPELASINGMTPSQTLLSPPAEAWATIKTACQAVANAAHFSLQWIGLDAPYTDMFPQSGTKAIAALQSLASRCGKLVCWNGDSGFVCTDPWTGWGSWSLTSCKLIISCDELNIRDLSGFLLFPVPLKNDGTVTVGSMAPWNLAPAQFIPPSKTLVPQLSDDAIQSLKRTEIIGGISGTKLSSSDPPRYFPLPTDADTIWIQILVQNSTADLNCTTDANTWFPLSSARVENMDDKTRRIRIDYNDFPTSNSDINDGHFTCSIGYRRDISSLIAAFLQKQQEDVASGSSVTTEQVARMRLVKTKVATATCVFHGHVPLPGNICTLNGPNGVSITGIIENVNISMPGIMTIQVAEYHRLNFYVPKGTMDASSVIYQASNIPYPVS